MICPDDGTRLSCTDSRQKDGFMSRAYKCPKCKQKFYTAEVFRDIGTPGKQLNISGEAFGKQQIEEAKQRIVQKLQDAIHHIMED